MERYLALRKELDQRKGKPVSERTRSIESYMEELDAIYMGELTVHDREKLRETLGNREL